jgi:hypothetical protein
MEPVGLQLMMPISILIVLAFRTVPRPAVRANNTSSDALLGLAMVSHNGPDKCD